jgi:hypothetical protein
MMSVLSAKRLGAVGAVAVVMSFAVPPAEAGFRYYCSCQGKKAMYLAGTRACEVNTPRTVKLNEARASGAKRVSCTRAEYTTWHRATCSSNGCALPK